MSHQPFEAWLLDPEEIATGERRRLANHLDECQQCRSLAGALADLDGALHAAPPVTPPAGFAERFALRLARERSSIQRRQTVISLAAPLLASLTVLAVLFGMSASQLAGIANDLMRGALALWLKVSVLAGLAWSLLENLPPTAFPAVIVWPVLTLMLLTLFVYSVYSVVWTALYLRMATRPIQWR